MSTPESPQKAPHEVWLAVRRLYRLLWLRGGIRAILRTRYVLWRNERTLRKNRKARV
jgi:hypothetical protein